MDMEFLMLQLVKFMELAETIKSGKTGKEKKEWVIERINEMLVGASEDVKELVPFIIDILIKVDKHEITINPVVKSSCLKFMKCLNLS
jgi:hypothetical protein